MFELIDYKWALAGIAALISICNFSFYIYGVYKGRTKPHMYTWLIWSFVAVTVSAGQIFDGAGVGATVTVVAACNCLAVAFVSIKRGSKNINLYDKLCLLTCLIALAFWPLTKSPLLSIVIVTSVDLIGYIPTIRKSFNAPHEESLFIFLVFLFSISISFFALQNYTLITTFYFIAMNIANSSMVALLIIRRYQLGHKIWA